MRKKEKRLLFWRILLVILIVCNMALVFMFSAQNGTKSAALSQKITITIVEWISKFQKDETTTAPQTTPSVPEDTYPEPEETTPKPEDGTSDPDDSTVESEDTTLEPEETTTEPEEETTTEPEETTPEEETTRDPFENLTEEQIAIVHKSHTPVRKLAHMLEFGTLATLVFLLLVTWAGKVLWRYAAALGFTLIYAATDELHQLYSDGRGARLSDVMIDFTGAFILCTLMMIVVVCIRRSRRLVTTYYDLPITPNGKELSIGLVTDLHGRPYEKLVERLRAQSPNIILLAGDIMEDTDLAKEESRGYAFLRACAEIAPTYYSLGNHETIGSSKKGKKHTLDAIDEVRSRVAKTGVTLLHNESVLWNDIRICALTSGLTQSTNVPSMATVDAFAAAKEFRILLCHHPEYYAPYIRFTSIDLTVCGHAHGGQWRFFGRGVYAPGQGMFPKYTAGVVENRLVISRGAGNHIPVPRIGNPRELVIIRCGHKAKQDLKNTKNNKPQNTENNKKEN